MVVIERLRALFGPSGDPPGHPAGPPAGSLRSSPQRPDDPVDTVVAGRLDPGLPGARALAAVGVLAALVAGGYLWSSRPRPQPVTGPAVPSAAAGPPLPASPAPASVVVHVAGKVRRPGVVTLTAGARVSEAVRAAGGLRAGARIGTLNLARRVVDGEWIPVGIPAAAGPQAVPGAGAAAGGAPGAQVDLNAATLEQFQQLPGVGPVLAQRIMDYRTRHGGFRSVEQLREVSGIGARRFADLRPLVRV